MKPYWFHPKARAEANAAFEYLRSKSLLAALNFDEKLDAAYHLMRKFPRLHAPYLHGTRRVLLDRYPYSVVYRELPRTIEVVAVAHAKRRPGYWANRLKQ
jgi:plasmid stabilization system protein ParE